MKILNRLSNHGQKPLLSDPPKIKFNWQTWIAPLMVFLINLFLVLPFWSNFWQGKSLAAVILFLAYVLGPVFFYFFVWELSNRRLTSFLAALIYSLPNFRLVQALIFGDGAHVVALGLLPLVLIFVLRSLRLAAAKDSPERVNLLLLSILGITVIALVSPFGLFTTLIFVGILTYSEMLLGQGRIKLGQIVLILLAVGGLTAFWYHPGFIIKVFQNEQGRALTAIIWDMVPLSFFLVPVLGAFSFLIFDRRPPLQPLFFGLASFFIFFLLVYVGTNISSTYVPVPSRFLPELSLSGSFLLAFLLVNLSNFLGTHDIFRLPNKISNNLSRGIIFFSLTFSIFSPILVKETFWNAASNSWEKPLKLVSNGGGVDQFLGAGISILTAFILVFLKISRAFLRIKNGQTHRTPLPGAT